MGWTSLYHDGRSNKEIIANEFSHIEKLSAKGSHIWMLQKDDNGKYYASVVLCERLKGELSYKDISVCSGPYHYDIPKSWLPLIKDTYKDSEMYQDWLKKVEEYQNKPKIEVGQYYKVNYDYSLVWDYGINLKPNQDFFVKVLPRKKYQIVRREGDSIRCFPCAIGSEVFSKAKTEPVTELEVSQYQCC